VQYLHPVKYTARRSVSGARTTRSASTYRALHAAVVAAVIGLAMTLSPRRGDAQVVVDTTVKTAPIPPVIPPTGTPGLPRIRLGRDTLPFRLPAIQSRTERESYRQAAAQIEAARATAFQQNMQTILESVWGQVATTTF